DRVLIAAVRVHLRVEQELGSLDEHHGAVLERLDGDLWALEVAHDADVAAYLLLYAPHRLDALRLIGRRAVREVDPEYVGAREDQFLEDGPVIRGRAERGDDLGAATHVFLRVRVDQGRGFPSVYGWHRISLKSLTFVRVGPVFRRHRLLSK